MAVKFNQTIKQGTLTLTQDAVLGFEDDRAEEYFIAAGWAEESDEEPSYVYPAGSVEIDVNTVHAETGELVLEQEA